MGHFSSSDAVLFTYTNQCQCQRRNWEVGWRDWLARLESPSFVISRTRQVVFSKLDKHCRRGHWVYHSSLGLRRAKQPDWLAPSQARYPLVKAGLIFAHWCVLKLICLVSLASLDEIDGEVICVMAPPHAIHSLSPTRNGRQIIIMADRADVTFIN